MGKIKMVFINIVTSSAFKRALWNFVNAVIVLVIQHITDAGLVEAGLGFAILNGITKQLNDKYGKGFQ